jgi:hypothetical protein
MGSCSSILLPEKRPSNTPSSGIVGVLILIGLAAMSSIWGWIRWRKHISYENDYEAYVVLKGSLSSAETDYRANDRDGNGINDFWTGDVAGLYQFGLIDRSIAEADVRPITPLVPKPIPRRGFFFVALDADRRENPPEPYRQDTDKKSGKVHNLRGFGFCAFPAGSDTERREPSFRKALADRALQNSGGYRSATQFVRFLNVQERATLMAIAGRNP